jgi:hypothetical protein
MDLLLLESTSFPALTDLFEVGRTSKTLGEAASYLQGMLLPHSLIIMLCLREASSCLEIMHWQEIATCVVEWRL